MFLLRTVQGRRCTTKSQLKSYSHPHTEASFLSSLLSEGGGSGVRGRELCVHTIVR